MSPPLPLTSSHRKGKNAFNLHKYLLSICYMPSTLLGAGDTEHMGKKCLPSWSLPSGGMSYSIFLECGLQAQADQGLALPHRLQENLPGLLARRRLSHRTRPQTQTDFCSTLLRSLGPLWSLSPWELRGAWVFQGSRCF